MRALAAAAAAACIATIPTALDVATAATTPAPAEAVTAVRQYVRALQASDPAAAYRMLSASQQRYFGNEQNFASDYSTTQYRVVSFAIKQTTARTADLAEVDVAEQVSFFDVAAQRRTTIAAVEAYFALREGGTWMVKELYQPWKSFAPNATGSSGGLEIVVNRVEFFDRRIQVDCTIRNRGDKAYQVLPLLASTLILSPGGSARALDTADFPLNDQQFFEGVRIYPAHQVVGYLNFPLSRRADVAASMQLIVGPAIEDGADAPASVTIGPATLPKL
jgi:hypothetical protein